MDVNHKKYHPSKHILPTVPLTNIQFQYAFAMVVNIKLYWRLVSEIYLAKHSMHGYKYNKCLDGYLDEKNSINITYMRVLFLIFVDMQSDLTRILLQEPFQVNEFYRMKENIGISKNPTGLNTNHND